MAKKIYTYSWVLKIIAAAILLAFGITMKFVSGGILLLTGIVIALFSIIRVVPLLKTLDKEVLRTINLFEIIIDAVIGGLMIYFAVTSEDGSMGSAYRLLLATVCYLRGIVFFTSTSFFKEKTDVRKFVFHIVIFTIGSMLYIFKDFDINWLSWLILFLCIVSGAYIGYDGFNGYRKYRLLSTGKATTKTVADDTILDKKGLNINKIDEPKKEDSIVQ